MVDNDALSFEGFRIDGSPVAGNETGFLELVADFHNPTTTRSFGTVHFFLNGTLVDRSSFIVSPESGNFGYASFFYSELESLVGPGEYKVGIKWWAFESYNNWIEADDNPPNSEAETVFDGTVIIEEPTDSGGTDDGTNGGTDDGTNGGTDDGTNGGTDDGTDSGTDDGTDGGTDDGVVIDQPSEFPIPAVGPLSGPEVAVLGAVAALVLLLAL